MVWLTVLQARLWPSYLLTMLSFMFAKPGCSNDGVDAKLLTIITFHSHFWPQHAFLVVS